MKIPELRQIDKYASQIGCLYATICIYYATEIVLASFIVPT